MDEDNFYKTGKLTRKGRSKTEPLTSPFPLPPKILVESDPSVLEGHTLDNRFLIIRDLSKNGSADQGGIGLVYLAEDIKLLSKKVVIKILQETASKNEDLARKFIHEKEALIRLDHHPNVVRLLDSGTLSDGNPYMVMEYIHGYSLRRVLKENGTVSLDFCAHIIESITNALFAAHSKKILHRDVKPENIMLTPQEESFDHVRLIDFGIARVTESQLAPTTQIERAIGTVLYISPEQLMGQLDQSPAADIYSCGVVAYEMLTGRLPFDPHTTVEMFLLQEKGVQQLPRELRPEIPEAAERLILHALAFDPQSRPQNIRIFGRNLADALRHVGDTRPKYEYERELADTYPDYAGGTAGAAPATFPDVRTGGRRPESSSSNKSVITEVSDPGKRSAAHPRFIVDQPPEAEKKRAPAKGLMWYGLGLVILVCAGLFAGFSLWKSFETPAENSAADVRSAGGGEKPDPALLTNVSYYLNVQKMRSGKPFEEPFRATGREIFESGYKFKMIVSSSRDGYLYIFNEGKNKEGKTAYYILYPVSEEKDAGQMKAGVETETGYQIFGGGKGTEIIWLVWTHEENPDLQSIKKSALDGAGGMIEEARASELLSAFLQKHSDARADTIKDAENQTTTVAAAADTIVHRLTLDHK